MFGRRHLLAAALLVVVGCAEPATELSRTEGPGVTDIESPPSSSPTDDLGRTASAGPASVRDADDAAELDAELPTPPPLTVADDVDVPPALLAKIEDAYRAAYVMVYRAAATGVPPEPLALRETHTPRYAEKIEAFLDELETRGVVDRPVGTVARSATLTAFQGGRAVVLECHDIGPRAGLYDRRTGELLQPVGTRVLATERELTAIVVDDVVRWRVDERRRSQSSQCEEGT